jgi:hypothetical protein
MISGLVLMISGLVTPQSIGLTDKDYVYKMVKRQKLIHTYGQHISLKFIPMTLFLKFIDVYFVNCSIRNFILIGIPYSTLWAFAGFKMFDMIFWQIVYFGIISNYLKNKIKVSNNKLKDTFKKGLRINLTLMNIPKKLLNKIYVEISDYNDSYWAIFLFWTWILLTSFIICLLYLIVLGLMNFIQKMLFYSLCLLFGTILILILSISSSLNSEAFNIYKLLFPNIATNPRSRNSDSLNIRMKVRKNFSLKNILT